MASEKRPFGEGVFEVHDFTLFLHGLKDVTSEMLVAMCDAGCDDGTLSSRPVGNRNPPRRLVSAMFSREAATREEAVASAIEDMKRVFPGCRPHCPGGWPDDEDEPPEDARHPIPHPEAVAVAKPSTMYTTFDELKADYDRLNNPE